MTEYATGSRFGAFPSEWGIPRGDKDSAERLEWVRSNIEQRLDPYSQLARRDAKLAGILRQAAIRAREQGP